MMSWYSVILAGFDLSEFSGRIIVTLDGGVAP